MAKGRVLMAKVGLDGHDVGARVVSMALADAGFEVIYTGLRQTPEMVVQTAIQEDVDVIGISILSGSHLTLLPEVIRILNQNQASEVHLIAGGIIPMEDFPRLKKIGVKEIFPPETKTDEIVFFVKRLIG
jgi:methylmalonyl-CoA mutase C-terminal domain/subunit